MLSQCQKWVCATGQPALGPSERPVWEGRPTASPGGALADLTSKGDKALVLPETPGEGK